MANVGDDAMAEPERDKADRATEARLRAWLGEQEQVRRGLVRCGVTVVKGCATLVGRSRSRTAARGIVEGARRVGGVGQVVDSIVADDELELAVAGAIGCGGLNRRSRLVVRADFGQVRIGGAFESNAAEAEAMRIGAAVPGVAHAEGLRATDRF